MRAFAPLFPLLLLAFAAAGSRCAAQAAETLPEPQYTTVARGVDSALLQVPSVPWRIFIVRWDRQEPTLELSATVGGGDRLGLATVPAQARASATPDWTPLAAVNGGYFRETFGPERGTLAGLLVRDGELLARPANTSFWVDATNGLHLAVVQSKMEIGWPDGTASPLGWNELPGTNRPALITARYGESIQLAAGLGLTLRGRSGEPFPTFRPSNRYRVLAGARHAAGRIPLTADSALLLVQPTQRTRLESVPEGAELEVRTIFSHDLSTARSAIGAGPTLLTAGVPNPALLQPGADKRRNPRTALGFNARYGFLIVVDGRGLRSAGMNFAELARLCVHLQCREAMNLDGGTSTTLWLNGEVLNSPAGWITPAVADALVLRQRREQR